MRRLLCMVLTGAVMIGCLCTGTGAVDESNVVSKEYETTGTAITRATGNLDWTIKANGTVVADTSFTMSAGETVRIRANYSPENASLDFGLVDSNEKFHYIKNPSEAVSYMQDRQETYTVPLYDLQEEVIGEFEIGCAMDVTGYSLEEAKEMVNLGERAGSVLSVEQTSLINGNFPKNVRGETYGTALMAEVVGEMPDLQAAIGTNDQEGYVRTSDLSHPKFETPQDALEWQKTQPDSYYIPLYDFQGNEIGSFLRERNNLTIAEMEAMKG